MPVLICIRVAYLSNGDEKAFFDWLNSIKAIRKWNGIGDNLLIHVPQRVSATSYRELDAMFRRYKVGRKQLAQLSTGAGRRGAVDTAFGHRL
jgi:hypothetical protein